MNSEKQAKITPSIIFLFALTQGRAASADCSFSQLTCLPSKGEGRPALIACGGTATTGNWMIRKSSHTHSTSLHGEVDRWGQPHQLPLRDLGQVNLMLLVSSYM